MNRLGVSLGVLVATLLSLLAITQPRPARAICYCGNLQNNVIYKAKGPDCTTAQNNLEAKAGAAVDCFGYNFCAGPTFTITTACYWDAVDGVYRIEGKMTYRCDTGDTCP